MGAAAGGVASGAAAGASAGAVAGPWGMAIGAAGGAALSLAQAGEQKDAAKAAQRTAETAAREQERLLSQDFFKGLQMPMEAYGRAARETTSQVGQLVGALQEGDPRFLPGGVGKVAAAGIAGEAETRDAMAQEIYKRELAQAQSATNVNAELAGLEGQRLAGAQKTAAEARAAELASYGRAVESGMGALNIGLSTISPFGASKQATGPNPNFQSKTGERFEGNPGASWQAAFSIPDTSKYAWSS